MLIHKLIGGVLKNRGCYVDFFLVQALDAIKWIQKSGVVLNANTTVLDLGCGFGHFGGELAKLGCQVTLADDDSFVLPEYNRLPFKKINVDHEAISRLGAYDLVICSNVLEHLSRPDHLLESIPSLLKPGGKFYLSWTNWYSVWGGHEFSPFHYLGPKLGYKIYTKWLGKPSQHIPFQNLFPTHIGSTLRLIRSNPHLRINKLAPRYYSELAFLMYLPILREFLAWNCAMMIEKRE